MSPRRKSFFKTDTKTTNLYMKTSALYWASTKINWSDPFYMEEGYFNTTYLSDIVAQSKDLKDFAFLIYFDGEEINEFLPVYTDMGLCLRFNAEGTIYTSKHGALYNLHVYMNVMTYFDYFSHMLSSGVKIAVHDPQVDPIMVNEGIVLQPGTEGYIEISRNEYKFLPEPYTAFGNRTCVDIPSYSSNNCHLKCWNGIIQKQCGCTDFLSDNDTFCSYRDYLECSNPTFWTLLMTYHTESCDCPLECNYRKYGYTFSTGQFPSDFFAEQFRNILGWDKSFTKTNLAVARIYFKDLSTTVTKQKAVYEHAGDIFANLGGQLGLFLGASILTITELLEFIIILVWSAGHKCYQRKFITNITPVQDLKPKLQDH